MTAKKALSKSNLTILTVGALALLWVVGALILSLALPEHYFTAYHIIPAVFITVSVIFIQLMYRWENSAAKGDITHSKAMQNIFGMKSIKMLLYIAVLFLCVRLMDKEHAMVFLWVFLVYYVVSLALETFAISNVNKAIAEKVAANKKEENIS